MPKLAIRHLRELRKQQDARRLTLGEAWREHGLVFASTIGTPIEPRNINRRWDELRQQAGLEDLIDTWCGRAPGAVPQAADFAGSKLPASPDGTALAVRRLGRLDAADQ